MVNSGLNTIGILSSFEKQMLAILACTVTYQYFLYKSDLCTLYNFSDQGLTKSYKFHNRLDIYNK